MREAVRAIVIHDNKLLVIKRNKFGKIYYTLPGGGISPGESGEQAVLREIAEETSLQIRIKQPRFIDVAGAPFGTQYVYECDYVSGEPKLSPQSEEAVIHAMGKNLYDPMWLPLEQLAEVPFVSPELKIALLDAIAHGFPPEPKQIP